MVSWYFEKFVLFLSIGLAEILESNNSQVGFSIVLHEDVTLDGGKGRKEKGDPFLTGISPFFVRLVENGKGPIKTFHLCTFLSNFCENIRSK